MTLEEMYNSNNQQINNLLNANREIQQTIGNINDAPATRNNRRLYVLSEYSIETLHAMYNQNAAHIERFMTLNREIQRAIINTSVSTTPVNTPNTFTYEFSIPFTNMILPEETTQVDRTLIQTLMEPVVIAPNQEQIRSATRRAKYRDISRPVNTTCPISLEPFADADDVVMIRHCGHIFKPTEFETWFRSNCRCPTCRYDIREHNS